MPTGNGSTRERNAPAVHVEGVQQLLRALSKIDKDLQGEVRDASTKIAQQLVDAASRRAVTPLQRLAMTGIKVRRDRIPSVAVGRTALPGRPGVKATDVFYGAEFGGGRRATTRQFPAHRGRRGYFLYPAARDNGRRFYGMWGDAIDRAFKAWDNRQGLGGLI